MSQTVADAANHSTSSASPSPPFTPTSTTSANPRLHHTSSTPATSKNRSSNRSGPSRPVPSPLHESLISPSSSPDVSGSFTTTATDTTASITQPYPPLPVDRVRAPNPAKKAPSNPALEEIRSVVTRDVLREEARKTGSRGHQLSRNVSAPILATSPPLSPAMMPSTTTPAAVAARADHRPIMAQRTASIDSTVSSVSSLTTGSQKPSSTSAYRVPSDTSSPQDVASLIAAAGSGEAAVLKLANEKHQAASHNAQLWRLVEKQRSMILGLNKDLEKALKEKERYRRKLKDQLAQSQSAPVLQSTAHHAQEVVGRDMSESPALAPESSGSAPINPMSLRDLTLDDRKTSDTSDTAAFDPTRSDTPQDLANLPSSGLPATPQSSGSGNAATREVERPVVTNGLNPHQIEARAHAPTTFTHVDAGTPPLSPRALATPQFAKSFDERQDERSSAISPSAAAQSFSSPKSPNKATRKAPPAPLQLSPKPVHNVTNNIIDASDSEYGDEDAGSARAEQMRRGRRKTREEDDREREALAREEAEYRSRSKKEKKSKSRPSTEKDAIPADLPSPTMAPSTTQQDLQQAPDPKSTRIPAYPSTADPVAILRQRALSDTQGGLPKSQIAPALLSPGLPMSPRPGDRPLGSPMPRAPNKLLNSIPMSPKAGIAGLPLSPRAPRHALPLPPQTPLTFASPHLARAEAYQQQSQVQQGSIADRLKPSPDPSPEPERPSLSNDSIPKTPGEVYTGLVTEQYPDLLLPPNALPSVYVKTSSSRMRPSRQSYIAPKHVDENPVLTLAVHERSDNKQLWRLEKTFTALATLDQQIRAVCSFRDRFPDKTLFTGHAPAKIDARRSALDTYLDRMLDAIHDERAAKVLCKFLSTDAFGAEGGDYFGGAARTEARPDTPVTKLRQQRAGYLTKRGKNFGGWKARYFVLDGPSLKYFEAPGGAHLGSIKLLNAQIGKQSNSAQQNAEDEENQFRHAFLILEPKKKDSTSLVRHVLCAESDDERDAWVEALLQYVDFRDEDEAEKAPRGTMPDISATRSPRLQKSMNDLRPPSRSNEPTPKAIDPLRAVHYNETVAGEAPVIGPGGSRKVETPSPPSDGSFVTGSDQALSNHPNISGPTNLQVISNSGDWGMKPPPTPSSRDHGKDVKKRGMFAAFRGRSSSDLAPGGIASPGLPPAPPSDSRSSTGMRAVFGVPLAEAVEFAHPVGATTELPAVVYRCIEYLTEKNAITEEGIFRLSGSNTVIKALKDRFNAEGDVNLIAEGKYYDIHAVASLLKLYFRELPSSILTRDLHLEFLHCLELHGQEKVVALNVLVNHLPRPNRALLEALAAFLLDIVNNADVNKMNVRNVGIVFAPTLNVPAPLISSFVEDLNTIFGPPMDESESPISVTEMAIPNIAPTDLRSPRKQMFSDLPTPAYHQTSFQGDNTGMIPMQPSYTNYQMAPQGDGGFGSLNDAMRSPTVFKASGSNGSLTPREVKSKRRESAMNLLSASMGGNPQKKSSKSQLREEEGMSF